MNLTVEFLPEADKFIFGLDFKTRQKVLFNIKKTKSGLRGEWFQKLQTTNDLWEFRTLHEGHYIRVFAFWDKIPKQGALILCTHGFLKTKAKTPLTEIKKRPCN